MLDLESYLVEWRQRMAAELGDDRTTLDELECHLRDDIQALMQQGLALDEAVTSAVARLGAPATLAQEFDKNTQLWWPILVWGAVLLCVLIPVLVWIGIHFSRADAGRALLLIHVACVTVGYVLAFGVGGLAVLYSLQRAVRDLPRGQRAFWKKTVLWATAVALGFTIVAVALGAMWAADHLGSAWSWDAREIGGLLVIVWLAVLLSVSRHLRWLLCAALFGNLIVAFAWFVAPRIQNDLWLSGLGYLVALSVLVLAHVLLMAASLAPVGWLRRTKTPATR